jgi:Uma2 family endonuclease
MPEVPSHPRGFTAERYFGLVEEGLLAPDEKVELLEGLIVSMSPQSPEHASSVWKTTHALERAVGDRALVRSQFSFVASDISVPEPDVCVVEGAIEDYEHRHPSAALLMVEVAWSTLAPDRLTKSRIYAAAGVPEYWIVNLRDRTVEVHTKPDASARVYADTRVAREGEKIALQSIARCEVAVSELMPSDRESPA